MEEQMDQYDMQTTMLPVAGHGDAATSVWGGSGARQGDDGVVVMLPAGGAGFTGNSAPHAPAQTGDATAIGARDEPTVQLAADGHIKLCLLRPRTRSASRPTANATVMVFGRPARGHGQGAYRLSSSVRA